MRVMFEHAPGSPLRVVCEHVLGPLVGSPPALLLGVGTCRVTRRDDSQASTRPSWIEALHLRMGDEPTDLHGMCPGKDNSSVALRYLAYLLLGQRRRGSLMEMVGP